MKLTAENEMILRKLGFSPDTETKGKYKEYEGWWSLDDGWTFRLDSVKNFKDLVKSLVETEKLS